MAAPGRCRGRRAQAVRAWQGGRGGPLGQDPQQTAGPFRTVPPSLRDQSPAGQGSPRCRPRGSSNSPRVLTLPSSFVLLLLSSKGLERAKSGLRPSVLSGAGAATRSGVKDDTRPRTPAWREAGMGTGDPDTE